MVQTSRHVPFEVIGSHTEIILRVSRGVGWEAVLSGCVTEYQGHLLGGRADQNASEDGGLDL